MIFINADLCSSSKTEGIYLTVFLFTGLLKSLISSPFKYREYINYQNRHTAW